MLQILLVFILISVVRCEPSCPNFSSFKHRPELLKEFHGKFYKIATSGTVVDCERVEWIITPDNKYEAYNQSPSCCMHANNTDISNPDYFDYDVAPIGGSACPTITSTERVKVKILQKIGYGDSRCFLVYFCRDSRFGVFLMCLRLPTLIDALLQLVNSILRGLLGLLGLLAPIAPIPIPELKQIKQTGCLLSNTCHP